MSASTNDAEVDCEAARPITPVVDDTVRHRFVLNTDDTEASIEYRVDGEHLYLVHTEVAPALRGKGSGVRLIAKALDVARREQLTIVPWCPFVRRWLHEHPEAREGVAVDWLLRAPERPHG